MSSPYLIVQGRRVESELIDVPFSCICPMDFPTELSLSNSLKAEQRRLFYERNTTIAVVMILIVFLMPFAGVFVRGLFGAVCGVGLSVLAYYLTPYIVLKMR